MSLINDVLRKVDQAPVGNGSGTAPSQLQPARGNNGASPAWLGVIVVAVFIAGAAAGGVFWWVWLPPQASSGRTLPEKTVSPEAKQAEADAVAEPSSQSPGNEPPEGSDAETASGPNERSAPAETEGPEAESSEAGQEGPLEMELPPMPEESARVQVQPPQSPVADRREEGSSPPLKRPRSGALKEALVSESERRLAEDSGSREESEPTGGGGRGQADDKRARVQVEVPDSWQREQQAAELARSGYRALANERYRKAVEQLGEARKLAPDRTDVLNNLALAQWQAGSPEEAITTLTAGLSEHPEDPRMAQNLAHFLLRRGGEGDRESGLKPLATALEQQDRLPLYALVGNLYRKMGRPGDAVRVYRSGIARNGAHWRLLVGLGLALEGDGQKARAAEVFVRAREEVPEGQKGVRESIEDRLKALPAASGN